MTTYRYRRFAAITVVSLFACNDSSEQVVNQQAQIDALEARVNSVEAKTDNSTEQIADTDLVRQADLDQVKSDLEDKDEEHDRKVRDLESEVQRVDAEAVKRY